MTKSMKFYGFEDYTIYFLYSRFWKGIKYSGYSTSLMGYSHYTNIPGVCNIRIVNNETVINNLSNNNHVISFKENPFIKSKIHIPKDGECLYFDPSCKIPRIKCSEKWQRTIKVVNADAVVVPSIELPYVSTNAIVFVNETNKTMFIQEGCDVLTELPKVGDTLEDMIEMYRPFIKATDLEDSETRMIRTLAEDAKVLYVGNLYYYSNKTNPLFNIVDGIYQKIVFEDDLLNMLGDTDNKFTKENIASIIELIKSRDKDTVYQGLRVLAEMDYTHYPSVTRYILDTTEYNWKYKRPFNSAVQFMLKKLERWGYYSIYKHVTPEEFDLIKDLFLELVNEKIKKTFEDFKYITNMDITYNYNVDVQLNNESSN